LPRDEDNGARACASTMIATIQRLNRDPQTIFTSRNRLRGVAWIDGTLAWGARPCRQEADGLC
jgi:hypothetical protein